MPQSEETRQKIIEAAQRFLWDRPFREMTVGALMDPLPIGRSAFYIHFQDRYELAAELLDMVQREMLEASEPTRARGVSAETLRTGVRDMAQVWVRHGPLTRAISEASVQDQKLEDLYRWGFVERLVDRIAKIVEAAHEGSDVVGDASEIALPLAIMIEGYLCDQLGRHPQADPDQVTQTLVHVLGAILYGQHPQAL